MTLSLLVCLILFSVCPTVTAQSEQCDDSQYRFPIDKLTNGRAVDRLFSLSTNSPVTKLIRSDKALSDKIDPLYDLFDTFTNILETRQQQNDSVACNVRIVSIYLRNSHRAVQRRQFGAFSEDMVCPSRLDDELAVQRKELSKKARQQAYDTLQTGLEALYQATSRIKVIPTLNWTRGTFRTFQFGRTQTTQVCTVDSLFAYRNQGRYYVRASVTNWPADLFVEDFSRQHINEYVPREGNTALIAPHIKFQTDCEFENSSTQLTRWGGASPIGHGGNAELGNRFSVLSLASKANSVAVDIAEDSLTGSNIAILALPMVMNFVPVACVADLNTFAMFCYVIFTDVFSTLPFLIKGVELYHTGNGIRRSLSAILLGNSTLGQMEIFTAKCQGKESYRVTGAVFIAVATTLMIFGVWLETFARQMMQKRRRKGEEGPFGKAMDQVLGYGPLGGHTEHEKMRRLTFEMMLEEGIGARDVTAGNSEGDENSMPRFPNKIAAGFKTWLGHGSGSRRRGRRRVFKEILCRQMTSWDD